MTREEAIRILASSCIPGSKQTEALETLIPELAESEDERIRKALIEVFKKKLEKGFEWVEYGIPNRSVLDWLETQKDSVSNAKYIEDVAHAFEDGRKKGIEEKQKEQKPLKVGENAYFDPNTEMWFIKKEQKLAEDKELLKNILFQKKGITYDDYKCKNDPYVGLSFYELIKCLEEYDKARSNR